MSPLESRLNQLIGRVRYIGGQEGGFTVGSFDTASIKLIVRYCPTRPYSYDNIMRDLNLALITERLTK
jgi:hypothetical protein